MNRTSSRGAILFAVCMAHFLMPFMMSAVGVALPDMGREFSASAMQLGLVETTYVLSASIFLLTMGRFGDIHGRRKIFQFGILFFTATGGVISQAWSIEAVIGLRFLQGMGGAMVMATTMAIVVSVFPPNERGRALGIAVASVYAGISCGPFFGGILVASFGWRSIFYLVIPLGLFTYLVTRIKMNEEWAEAAGEPFDWPGALVYAWSILLLILGVSNLSKGWWGLGAAAGSKLRYCAVPLVGIAQQIPDPQYRPVARKPGVCLKQSGRAVQLRCDLRRHLLPQSLPAIC